MVGEGGVVISHINTVRGGLGLFTRQCCTNLEFTRPENQGECGNLWCICFSSPSLLISLSWLSMVPFLFIFVLISTLLSCLFLPPSLPSSLPPSLPSSLPPSLPSSLPLSLPHSLPQHTLAGHSNKVMAAKFLEDNYKVVSY